MSLLISLIPAFLWGIQPLLLFKIKGNTIFQLLGTVYGTLIVSIIIYFFNQPQFHLNAFFMCMLSGASWTFGQFTQYVGFKEIGIASGTPIATALQLIGNPLTGILLFNEWPTLFNKLFGFLSLSLIIIGGIIIARVNPQQTQKKQLKFKHGFWILFIGTFGYIGYSTFPKLANVGGTDAILPQAFGMVITAIIIAKVSRTYHAKKVLFDCQILDNLILGFVFGIAAFYYLVSVHVNGVANGFIITQMDVVISTLGGIVIFKEIKKIKAIIFTILGLILIIIGGIVTSLI
ncbi:glucose uptake protein [Philodulcilactobacillus myokoensis]|uniref:Glucose uptake protein n=1 Tax=Philodulcilactobacillus myokoensis TaxID=2929573 RepID=A0A9W6B0K4_9LACO|nr:GRP family sugar transporter [Philodulcilactobacillus myokoensis]GLB46690.1 glucose uptake protein [Philodulcilactobacillus myokoensis]